MKKSIVLVVTMVLLLSMVRIAFADTMKFKISHYADNTPHILSSYIVGNASNYTAVNNANIKFYFRIDESYLCIHAQNINSDESFWSNSPNSVEYEITALDNSNNSIQFTGAMYQNDYRIITKERKLVTDALAKGGNLRFQIQNTNNPFETYEFSFDVNGGDFSNAWAELTGLEYGESITSDGFKYVVNAQDEVCITGYKGNAEKVTIPAQINGLNVTSIGENAFSMSRSLVSIIIPDSVTYIASRAFSSCRNLESVTIPDSVTYIGDAAFCNCQKLNSITIPDSVITMGSNPFFHCPLKIIVSPDHPVFATIDGVLFDKTERKLVSFPRADVTSYTIPNGIKSIGTDAFRMCDTLRSITIPDSVTNIGDYAFYLCDNLDNIIIPEGVTNIGEATFADCHSLNHITLPGSVISIGDLAFCGCNNLNNITIPDCVTSIGDSAFYSCDSLKSITIPDSVITMGSNPFYDCSLEIIVSPDHPVFATIDGVLFDKTERKLVSFPRADVTSYTIPNGIKSIGEDAFRMCDTLRSITVPDTVTHIGAGAFYGCDTLTLTVGRNSYAKRYAIAYNILYTYPDALDWLNN